jgi:hypothetical protein
MLASWRLVLKHHRFEVGFGAATGLALAAGALWVAWQLTSLNVPVACFDAWLAAGPFDAGACTAPVQAFATINEEWAGKIFTGLGLLPLVLGLASGVTIVGRELEGRTAQTAWALMPSRRRWLGQQVLPVIAVVVVVAAVAGLAGTVLEAIRLPWYNSAFNDLILHGPPIVGRSIAAFGIGILTGAVVGRVLPALLVGVVVAIALLMVSGDLHDGWKQANVEDIANPESGRFAGLHLGDAFRDATGRLVSVEDASFGAPPEEDTYSWVLEQHPDWTLVTLGIPAARAGELAGLDALGFGIVGLVAFAAAVPVVDRRRPT